MGNSDINRLSVSLLHHDMIRLYIPQVSGNTLPDRVNHQLFAEDSSKRLDDERVYLKYRLRLGDMAVGSLCINPPHIINILLHICFGNLGYSWYNSLYRPVNEGGFHDKPSRLI